MQKASHMMNELQPPELQVSYFQQRRWQVGFAIFLFGQVANMIAMGFSSQVPHPLHLVSVAKQIPFFLLLLNGDAVCCKWTWANLVCREPSRSVHLHPRSCLGSNLTD